MEVHCSSQPNRPRPTMELHYSTNGLPLWLTGAVSTTDGERLDPRSFRPEPAEYADAQQDLTKRKRRMTDFLRACLAWLHADPDGALATLAPHWPAPRPRGWKAHRSREKDSQSDT
jgi:hypothetical protein